MSDHQLLRRQFGKGVKKGKLSKRKVPLKKLKYIGALYKKHHIPIRHLLTDYGMIDFADNNLIKTNSTYKVD
ncbi:hypothetical protein COJ67_03135 [Bacillus thuringiensis]|nr:hypothetical protein COJ67_03135 [Bacillus thuringiensis]PGY05571.1 hypothetical protein COE41_02915 [Bacillus thuringiensis]